MTAKELVIAYARKNPNTLVTPTIVKAWGETQHVRINVGRIAEKMRRLLPTHSAGVFIAQPKSFGRQAPLPL